MSAPVDYPTLYSLTGDVKDINTLLVPAAQLDAIGAGGVSAPVAQLSELPKGWELVPIDPTPEMSKAACDAWLDCLAMTYLSKAHEAAKAAIAAAAPTTPKDIV